jgi:hypothetical protein
MTSTLAAPSVEQLAPHVVTKVKDGDLSGAQNALLGVGLLLLIIAGAMGMTGDDTDKTARFYFSYLTAYVSVLGIGLGALVFVMIQHITRAGWSVVVRRLAENTAAALPWMLLLFIPILVGFKQLFHWEHIDPKDEVLFGKSGWLNPTFFFVRVGIYFAVWIALATYFRRMSQRQDLTGDPAISLRLSRVAAPGILLFALSLTFAAFDWIMSLNPHWFSTIFGVTYFAGAFMAFYAFTILMAMWLGKRGYLKDVVNTEHFHDLAKLLFTFMVFWTYTNFSQYMLIWYANQPEETQFYLDRQEGGWTAAGTMIVFGHFFIPFAFLMSRHIKRNPLTLAIGAIFLLVIHWLDMQYLVLPNFHPHAAHAAEHAADVDINGLFANFGGNIGIWLANLRLSDFLCFFGMLSFFTGVVVMNVRRSNLLPTRDPRLAESIAFLNH